MRVSKAAYLPISIVLLVSLILLLVVPATNHDIFIISLITSALISAVYVASWDLLAGYTGLFNFGHMIFAGTAAYVVALLEVNFAIPRPLIILVGIAGSILSSFLIGLPSLRVRSVYFVLVSFVVPLILNRITMSFTAVFGGEYGLSVNRVYSRETVYYAAIVLLASTLIILKMVVMSRIGITLQSIREDEETARAVGINVPLFKLLACMISSVFAGLAGICFFYHMSHVGPEIFSIISSFNVVIMGLAGGIGTLFGTAIGGGGLSLVIELMRPVAIYRNISYAALLVLIVMVFPKGFWGGIASISRKAQPSKVKV
jgi:branched-chain amino acid transport system permease protein